MMEFITACVSHKGGREKNEDTISVVNQEERFIAIVADGLGSHGQGEIASQIACDTAVEQFLSDRIQSQKRSYEKADFIRKIDQNIQEANQAVIKAQTVTCKMKTTIAMLVSVNGRLAAAHVGDSRIYWFRSQKIMYQSKDHSVSQLAADMGEINKTQIRFHEDRNRLLRALGAEITVKPSIRIFEDVVRNRDAFLLCSDGFWEYITEEEMLIDLAKSCTPSIWLGYMLERIGKRVNGKHDNLSAITMIYQEGQEKTI